MAFTELAFEPGIYTEQTPRGAKGRWKDCQLVRFVSGLPEKIGGWTAYESLTTLPVCRTMHSWSDNQNKKWLALGTTFRLYLLTNDTLYNITPIQSEGALTNPFTTTSASAVVTVSDVAHGLQPRQYVTFSGASAVGGVTINGDYQVTSVVGDDAYTITHSSVASSGSTGGGSVTYIYEITPPEDENSLLQGWGSGPYGKDTDPDYLGSGWGTSRLTTNQFPEPAIWSLDNWGEDLIASRRSEAVYVWDRTNGPTTRATLISTAPASNVVLVSPEDRHLISLGSTNDDGRDQALVRWSDSENYNQWIFATGNSAGYKRLDVGSKIIAAVRTRGEIVILMDTFMHAMWFVGGDDVFAFRALGQIPEPLGQNAAIEVNGMVLFMTKQDFMVYDGTLRTMVCPIRTTIFDNLNLNKSFKTVAGHNKDFGEVVWFYPAAGQTEPTKYVIYNYREEAWYYGTLSRTAFIEPGFKQVPIACDANGNIFLHETGVDDNGTAMTSYLESHDTEIGIGEQLAHVSALIPDFITLTGSLDIVLKTKKYPRDSAYVTKGPYTITSSTTDVSARARGRQISIRITSDAVADDWRWGTMRADVVADGER